MYVHRALLLVFLALYVFTPTIQAWILDPHAVWYRPYIVWTCLIGFIYWIQRISSRSYDI